MFLHTERVSYETPDRDLEIEIFSSRNFAISYEYNVDFNSIIIITIPCNRIILKINEDIIQISQMNRLPSPNLYPPILSLLCSNIITIIIHTIPETISNVYFLHNIFSLHPIIHFPTTKYLQRENSLSRLEMHSRNNREILNDPTSSSLRLHNGINFPDNYYIPSCYETEVFPEEWRFYTTEADSFLILPYPELEREREREKTEQGILCGDRGGMSVGLILRPPQVKLAFGDEVRFPRYAR